jgi:endogenous inhibitor of DNA gyrase (YacG/DUF329 family)
VTPAPDESTPAPRRVVRCPACGGASRYDDSNPWRPFCSEGCRRADLGAWASERFRISAENPPDVADPCAAPPRTGDNG